MSVINLVKSVVAVTCVVIIFLAFSHFARSEAGGGSFLDEFSSIYHSNVIIEVGVALDKNGHPKESCYLKTIKGNKSEVSEVLEKFNICSKKGKFKIGQKRLMLFYRNDQGRLRSMDLIRQGIGPYSDEPNYLPYLKMVRLVNKRLEKRRKPEEGTVVLSSRSICKALLRNKYFRSRYEQDIIDGGFTVGGDPGAFSEFYPLVKIECKGGKG